MTAPALRRVRATRPPWDVVVLLSVFLVMRFAIPGRYVIGPLGGAGSPAQLVGLAIGLWWVSDWLNQAWPRSTVGQPLKRYAFALLGAVWVSYLIAAIRPTSPDEQLAADRSVLNTIAWIGLMMAAMDGIPTRARLDTLLRRVVLLGGLEAAFGFLQLVTGQTFTQYLQVPGTIDSGPPEEMLSRGSFIRPAGTATHPIEFGITLAMLLPVALHYAINDSGRRTILRRWWPVGMMALALALTISRSAIICTAISLIVLLASWPARARRRVYLAVPGLVVAMAFALPGFLSTITAMFTGISNDPSALSRADSYTLAWAFISRNPVFGRGTGTFLPRYRILDNQYLGSLIETGFVGLACILALILAGAVTAWRLGRPRVRMTSVGAVSDDPASAAPSKLGPALGAGILGAGASLAFFDAWAFALIPSMIFLLLGCVGALRRLTLEGDRPTMPEAPSELSAEPGALPAHPQAAG
jgi:O-antigen ligase